MASLKYGTTSSEVRALQEALTGAGYQIAVDGVYGSETMEAVKNYQTAHGLSATGEVDDATWGALTTPAPAANPGQGTGAGTNDALLNELMASIQRPAYTPMTEEEMRQQAQGAVGSYYDAQRLAAEQAAAKTDLALEQQLAGLGAAYDKQREATEDAYARAVSDTDRGMIGRGMQRSSYAAQTLANLREEGADALQDISDQETQAAGNISAQRAQLAQQLAQQMASLNVSEAADVQSRVDELAAREYEREQAALSGSNALALQIYQLLMDKDAQTQSRDQWEREFAESIRQFNISAGFAGGGSDGGSGGGSGGGYQTGSGASAGASNPQQSGYESFLKGMSGDAPTGAVNSGSAANKPGSALNTLARPTTGTTQTGYNKKQIPVYIKR